MEIPDGIIENATPLWEDFIVGKFLDLAPHIAKVHMVLNRIWKYGDPSTKIEVYEVNATTMRFKVSSQEAREKIIRRGMWNIIGVLMIVSKWSPKPEDEEEEDEAIPMWVHLEKVPLHMYSWEGLSLITSTVGTPVEPHPDTVACTNLAEAKIFVKVDVSKVLPKEITFKKEGKSFTVNFYYPWLPARCKHCEKWGHNEGVCGSKSKRKKHKNVPSSPSQESASKKDTSASPQSAERVKEVVERSEGKGNNTEGSSGEKIKSSEENEGIISSSSVRGWITISPLKTGRVLLNVTQKDDVEVSVSKFSVLSIDEPEEGEILENGKVQTEEADDNEAEDIETQDNESVEDTAIEQQVQEETKVGKRRGRKPKAQDENPGKSSRPRHKH